jgi:hypothetical protein
MRRSLRISTWLSIVALALLAFGAAVVAGGRPPMPSQWRELRTGMSREDALAVLRDKVTDMRELKGFDVTSRETTMFGASSYWQLLITYDAAGRVNTAWAHFIDRGCGFFNTKPMSVL